MGNEKLLQKLAEWRPVGSGRHALGCADITSGWTVTIEADRNDELGCLLWELTLRRAAPAGDALQAWAVRIAEQVTSLLEPLKVIEVDATRDEALLRSAQPTRRGVMLYYFEVLLKGTQEARLSRFQASAADVKPRMQIAAPLTHEALVMFVADATMPAE